MLDGIPLVDAHVHVPLLTTLRPAWVQWARDFGPDGILEDAWDADGVPRPERLDELFADQGVDVALLFCEYSPKVTGMQTFDDLLPIVEHNPRRFRPVANVNPYLHLPIAAEVERQLNDFPGLNIVLAHGGRSLWYDTAASLALSHETVWLELSGLPPKRLPEYYARFDLSHLARRWIFGTDWPGVPGTAQNARAVAGLLDHDVAVAVLGGNVRRVYAGLPQLPVAVSGEAAVSQRGQAATSPHEQA